jgi:hypothetical protein
MPQSVITVIYTSLSKNNDTTIVLRMHEQKGLHLTLLAQTTSGPRMDLRFR